MDRSVRAKLSLVLPLLVIVGSVVIAVATGDWGLLAVMVGAFAIYAVAFRAKLNGNRAIATEHGSDGRPDAVQYFWRPG